MKIACFRERKKSALRAFSHLTDVDSIKSFKEQFTSKMGLLDFCFIFFYLIFSLPFEFPIQIDSEIFCCRDRPKLMML